jgi:hypothetical protein
MYGYIWGPLGRESGTNDTDVPDFIGLPPHTPHLGTDCGKPEAKSYGTSGTGDRVDLISGLHISENRRPTRSAVNGPASLSASRYTDSAIEALRLNKISMTRVSK